jgi:hypothetical protein
MKISDLLVKVVPKRYWHTYIYEITPGTNIRIRVESGEFCGKMFKYRGSVSIDNCMSAEMEVSNDLPDLKMRLREHLIKHNIDISGIMNDGE